MKTDKHTTKYDFIFITDPDGLTVLGWIRNGKFVPCNKKTAGQLLHLLCVQDGFMWTNMTQEEYDDQKGNSVED